MDQQEADRVEAMSRARHRAGGCVAIGYRRVSTAEQKNSGLGLDAQQHALEVTAARLGLLLAQTFTDGGVSGAALLEQRPALIAAIDALGKGDTLLIAKRDRLGRSVLNVAMLERLVERKHARIVSAAGEGTDDDEPASIMLRQIVDVFAQFERAIIRQRTRAALAAKKARGERVGAIPYGYRMAEDARTLVRNEDEQRVLATLYAMRTAGYTLRGIADELNRRGVRTRCGGRWYHQFVAMLLARHDGKDTE